MNKVILIGNLGADPELKFTQGGQAILRLRVATSEKYKDRNGELQEATEWHTVVMWGPRAEALNKILTKGRTISVEGMNTTRSWEDKDGGKRSATEVKAHNIELVGHEKGFNGQRTQQRQEQPRNSYGPTATRDGDAGLPLDDLDDIPF